jgi:hypothetical protein
VPRAEHPSQRGQRRRLRVVQDAQSVEEWWMAERAQARRDDAVARLANTVSWCVVALACAGVVAILVGGYRSL